MYRKVVNICIAQWSLYIRHSDHYVPHSGHYMYHQFNIHQFHVLLTQLYFCVLCASQNKQRLFPNTGVSQPPGRGPVLGPGINYTRPREVLLEFVTYNFLNIFYK